MGDRALRFELPQGDRRDRTALLELLRAERLVTGSDGSAHYTDDHYSTFKKIR